MQDVQNVSMVCIHIFWRCIGSTYVLPMSLRVWSSSSLRAHAWSSALESSSSHRIYYTHTHVRVRASVKRQLPQAHQSDLAG